MGGLKVQVGHHDCHCKRSFVLGRWAHPGPTRTVLSLCHENPELGTRNLAYSPISAAHLCRARLLARMGRLAEAQQEVDLGVAQTRRRSEVEFLAWVLSIYASIAAWTGEDPQAAAAVSAEAVGVAQESGSVMAVVCSWGAVGLVDLLCDRFEEAAAALGRALHEARTHRSGLFEEPTLLAELARARLGLGDIDAARQTAEEAVHAARRNGARVDECHALLARAQIARAAGADASGDLLAALDVSRETGALTYEPFIRDELARLHYSEGNLHEALRLYTEIGATGHVQRLKAELNELRPRRTAE